MRKSPKPAPSWARPKRRANTAPAVLADLLALAADRGRLEVTDRLLRELVGPKAVNRAHIAWTARLREGLLGDTTPSALAEHSDSPAGPSEAALHLVRRLPDPSKGGQAGQAAR